MRPMTKEEAAEMMEVFEKALNDQKNRLVLNGWIQKEDFSWIEPETNKIHEGRDAYNIFTERTLLKQGWKIITEFKHLGNWKKQPENWARYQSPKTKRIYSFLEAQYIMEENWDENFYPDSISAYTFRLNEILGDNFQLDKIYTRFYLIDEEKWDIEVKENHERTTGSENT